MLMNEDSVLPDPLPDRLPAHIAQLPGRGGGQGPRQGLPAGSRRCSDAAQSSLTPCPEVFTKLGCASGSLFYLGGAQNTAWA